MKGYFLYLKRRITAVIGDTLNDKITNPKMMVKKTSTNISGIQMSKNDLKNELIKKQGSSLKWYSWFITAGMILKLANQKSESVPLRFYPLYKSPF